MEKEKLLTILIYLSGAFIVLYGAQIAVEQTVILLNSPFPLVMGGMISSFGIMVLAPLIAIACVDESLKILGLVS